MSDVDIGSLLRSLAQVRPVFHSEADLQHSFAWHLKTHHPGLEIRLETRPLPGLHLDLLAVDRGAGADLAIELKYLTAGWQGSVHGDHFDLLHHGAQDVRSYDCVNDIARLEKIVSTRPRTEGVAIVLSNDSSYWHRPSHGRATNAAEFRLHEGTVLSGQRRWGPVTGAGTKRNREEFIELTGSYRCTWVDYSTLPGRRGEFRSLIHRVSAET